MSNVTLLNTNILFISSEKVKQFCSITENLNNNLIKPYISIAQDQYVRDTIGHTLYESIKQQIKDSAVTETNSTLLNYYIQPCLAWWTYYIALPFIAIHVGDRGVLVKSVDNSASPVDGTQMSILRNSIKANAQHYSTLLKEYLCDNADTFDSQRDHTNNDTTNFMYIQF